MEIFNQHRNQDFKFKTFRRSTRGRSPDVQVHLASHIRSTANGRILPISTEEKSPVEALVLRLQIVIFLTINS
jgi:hypothetical protein